MCKCTGCTYANILKSSFNLLKLIEDGSVKGDIVKVKGYKERVKYELEIVKAYKEIVKGEFKNVKAHKEYVKGEPVIVKAYKEFVKYTFNHTLSKTLLRLLNK